MSGKVNQIIGRFIVVKITSWFVKSYNFTSQLHLTCKIEQKTRKPVKLDSTHAKSIKSVKSNRIYKIIVSIRWVVFLVLYE
jgi:hypothetical protein